MPKRDRDAAHWRLDTKARLDVALERSQRPTLIPLFSPGMQSVDLAYLLEAKDGYIGKGIAAFHMSVFKIDPC